MNKKISLGAAATFVILAVALTVTVTWVIAMRQFNYKLKNVSQRQAMFDYVNEVDKQVRNNYNGEIDEDLLRASIARGYIAGLNDPYAIYLTAAEYKKETERLSGKWTGLGLEVTQLENGTIVISAVHKNSPADKAGIKKGDVITQLDGKEVRASGFAQVRSKIESVDKIKLTVNRDDSPMAFEISSSSYTLSSVESRLIDTTGYIRISAFYSNTPDQFRTAFNSLEEKGAENYIFDLRFNKGGDFSAACEVISTLIPRGTYARCEYRNSTVDIESDGTFEITKPSVTLVNSATMREAELFAGVLQHFKKTTIVGVNTAGHGMVQKYYKLAADGAAIKISVASLMLADGGRIEGKGIQADVYAAMPAEMEKRFAFLTEKNDPQMQAAFLTLKGGQPDTERTTGTAATTTEQTQTQATSTTASQ